MGIVTAQMVKELREWSGLGPQKCKEILMSVDGDYSQALAKVDEHRRSFSTRKIAKKKTLTEGIVQVFKTSDGKKGLIVEVNCETDFVAKTLAFKSFVETVVNYIFVYQPDNVTELMGCASGDKTLGEQLLELVAQLGEVVRVTRFSVFKLGADNDL